MVILDFLGLFTLLLYLYFIKFELLVADKETHFFATIFDSIRDLATQTLSDGGAGLFGESQHPSSPDSPDHRA